MLTGEAVRKLAFAGELLPNGIQSMSMSEDLRGIVESSLNLGVVTTLDDCVEYAISIRSSVSSRMHEIAGRVKMTAEVLGAEFTAGAEYPGWEFNPNSKLQAFFSEHYKAFTGKDAVMTAVHAGLECGFLTQLLDSPDIISMGPDIFGAHSPDECLGISSTSRVWEFLKYALAGIK